MGVLVYSFEVEGLEDPPSTGHPDVRSALAALDLEFPETLRKCHLRDCPIGAVLRQRAATQLRAEDAKAMDTEENRSPVHGEDGVYPYTSAPTGLALVSRIPRVWFALRGFVCITPWKWYYCPSTALLAAGP